VTCCNLSEVGWVSALRELAWQQHFHILISLAIVEKMGKVVLTRIGFFDVKKW